MLEILTHYNPIKEAHNALKSKLREVRKKGEILQGGPCEQALEKLKFASGITGIPPVHDFFEKKGDEIVAINLAEYAPLKNDWNKKKDNHDGSIFEQYLAGILVSKGKIGTLSYGLVGPSSMTQSSPKDTNTLLKTMENDFAQNTKYRELIMKFNNLTQARIIKIVNGFIR
jgi:hypothetical protein